MDDFLAALDARSHLDIDGVNTVRAGAILIESMLADAASRFATEELVETFLLGVHRTAHQALHGHAAALRVLLDRQVDVVRDGRVAHGGGWTLGEKVEQVLCRRAKRKKERRENKAANEDAPVSPQCSGACHIPPARAHGDGRCIAKLTVVNLAVAEREVIGHVWSRLNGAEEVRDGAWRDPPRLVRVERARDRVGLARAGLSIGEHGAVVALQNRLDHVARRRIVHALLAGVRAKHPVECEGPFVRLVVHAAVDTAALLAEIHTNGLQRRTKCVSARVRRVCSKRRAESGGGDNSDAQQSVQTNPVSTSSTIAFTVPPVHTTQPLQRNTRLCAHLPVWLHDEFLGGIV